MATTTTNPMNLKQRIIPSPAATTNTTDHPPFSDHSELQSRGLLNSTYPLLKKVISEYAVLSLAGLTAVLLQIAHPGVGAGVGNHSNFSYRFIERSENTAMYIYTMVFGTDDEKGKMKRFVDRKHRFVNDKKGGKGKGKGKATYDAFDPELQLWVAITLYATYVPTYTSLFGPFPSLEAEQLLQEFSLLATSLQVPLSLWPRDIPSFEKYYSHIVSHVLRKTPQCVATAKALRNPAENVDWYYKPLLWVTAPLHWNASTEDLPEEVRGIFGLTSSGWSRGVHGLGISVLRCTYPLFPEVVRTWPRAYYLGLARKHMNKGRLG